MAESAEQNFSANDPYANQADDVFQPAPAPPPGAARAAGDAEAKNEPFKGDDPFVPPPAASNTSSPTADDARNIPSPCEDMTGQGACSHAGHAPSVDTTKQPGTSAGTQANSQPASAPATPPVQRAGQVGGAGRPRSWEELSLNLHVLWDGAKTNCASASPLEKNTAAWFDMCGKPPAAKTEATGQSAAGNGVAQQGQTATTNAVGNGSEPPSKTQNGADGPAADLCGALRKSASTCYSRLIDTMSRHGENGLVSNSGQGGSFLTCVKVYCGAMKQAKCKMSIFGRNTSGFCFTTATDDPDFVQQRNAACEPGKHLFIDPHSVEPICQDNVSGSGNPQTPSSSTITGAP